MLTAAEWVTVIAAIGSVLLGLLTTITTAAITIVLLITRRNVREVHDLVNSRSEKQDVRIEQLSLALRDAHIGIPNRLS